MAPSRQAGFTLLELLMVVTVAGILLAAGMPSFREALAAQRAKAAVSEMHLSMLMARSEAIKRAANVEIARSGSVWTGGWVVRVASDSTVLRTTDQLDAVDLECSTDTDAAAETCPAVITFSRSGRPASFIEFRSFQSDVSSVSARCVSMALGGRPRVVVDSDGDPSDGCD